ncbi:MAG: methyl-accepting chemotaxis protein [Thermodesulfobacteriota bacterium]
MPHYKRKKLNLNVKRQFQVWLLVRILGTIILSSLVAALILYFYARHETAASFYEAHLKIRRVSDLLLPVVIAGSLVSLLGGALLAIFLPQKIAGPMYRIEQDLQAVQRGDLTVQVRLREHDTMKDLAATINATLASLRDGLREVRNGESAAAQALEQEDLNRARQALAACRERLERFML